MPSTINSLYFSKSVLDEINMTVRCIDGMTAIAQSYDSFTYLHSISI